MADRFWVGGTGTWNGTSTTNWSATSGGAAGASAPTNADRAIFDANSGTGTVTTDATAVCQALVKDGASIDLVLGANLSMTGQLTLTAGLLDMAGFNLTCGNFRGDNTNVRTLAMGAGTLEMAGSGSLFFIIPATNMVVTGSKNVNFTYSGSVGTRQIGVAFTSESNLFNINVTAGSDTIFVYDNTAFNNLNFTGFSGTLGSNPISVYGDVTFSAGMTVTASANVITFASTNVTPRSIASNGCTVDRPLTFNGVGGSWQLADNLTVGATRAITLTNGTLNANGKNVSCGSFALGAGTKTLTLGSGTWTVAASGTSWNANTNVSNLTVSASTGTINMTSASAKTFAGGAKAWPTLNQGGAGALTIQQSNTFANVTNTVQPATITLTAGTTQTVSAFGVSGTAGNLITLNSSAAGSQATLSDSSGINSVSFVSIKDINATGGSIWDAPTTAGNVDAGNNLGWNFGIPFNYDIEFSPALRSFTERKQF